MNLETKIIIYKFTPQVFTLTPKGYEKKSWTSKQWYNWYSGYSASSASHTCAYVHYFITRTLFIYMRV